MKKQISKIQFLDGDNLISTLSDCECMFGVVDNQTTLYDQNIIRNQIKRLTTAIADNFNIPGINVKAIAYYNNGQKFIVMG